MNKIEIARKLKEKYYLNIRKGFAILKEDLKKIDFDLSYTDLSNIDFSKHNQTKEYNLSNINFSNANLTDSIIRGFNLSNNNFSGANLTNTTFEDLGFFRVNFEKSIINETKFVRCVFDCVEKLPTKIKEIIGINSRNAFNEEIREKTAEKFLNECEKI